MRTILISVEDHYYNEFTGQLSDWIHNTGFTYVADTGDAAYNFTICVHAGPAQPLPPSKPRHNTRTMIASDKGLEFGYAGYSGWKDHDCTFSFDRFISLGDTEVPEVLRQLLITLYNKEVLNAKEVISMLQYELSRVVVRDSDGDIHKLIDVFPNH